MKDWLKAPFIETGNLRIYYAEIDGRHYATKVQEKKKDAN